MKVKALLNPRVISAIVSAIGAIISALFAGCSLCMGELSIKDFKAEIFNQYHSVTNSMETINEQN